MLYHKLYGFITFPNIEVTFRRRIFFELSLYVVQDLQGAPSFWIQLKHNMSYLSDENNCFIGTNVEFAAADF